MTNDEFNTWLDDFRDRFPSTDEWISKQPNEPKFVSYWRDALRDVVFSEAMTVSARLMSGELPEIPNYDREKIPAIVRTHANAWRTSAARDRVLYQRTERVSPVGSSRELLLQMEKLIGSGMKTDEASKEVFSNVYDR